MQYSQEHLKTMVYAEFGGQTQCIMGNSKIENGLVERTTIPYSMQLKGTHFSHSLGTPLC